jgi:O-antigen ligase
MIIASTSRLAKIGVGFGLVASICVGVAVVALPYPATGLVLALLAFAILVRSLRFRPSGGVPARPTARGIAPDRPLNLENRVAGARRFAFARFVYYLGILTLSALAFRPFASITFSDWAFLAALLLAFLDLLLSGERLGLSISRSILLGSAIFAIGGLVSSVHAASPVASVAVVLRVLYLTIVWFWLGTAVLRRSQDVRVAVRLWVLSAAAGGVAAFIQLRGFDVVHLTSFSALRMTGLAEHVNDLGGITCIALVPALALGVASRTVRDRLVSYICLLSVVGGLILSGSLTGMAVGGVAVLLWAALVIKQRLSALIMVCALGVAVLGILTLQAAQGLPSPFERFSQSTFSSSDPNATFWSRINTDQVAWQSIQASPILGAGLDPNSGLTSTGYQVHNSLLGAWYEAGLLGILGLVLVFFGVMRIGRSVVVNATTQEDWSFGAALFISFLSFVAFGMAAPILYQRYGWVSAAVLLAFWSASTSRKSVELTDSPMPGAHPAPRAPVVAEAPSR